MSSWARAQRPRQGSACRPELVVPAEPPFYIDDASLIDRLRLPIRQNFYLRAPADVRYRDACSKEALPSQFRDTAYDFRRRTDRTARANRAGCVRFHGRVGLCTLGTSYAFRLRPGPDFSTDYCVQIVRVKMTSGRAETAGVRAIQRRPDVGGEILTSLRAPTTDMRARLARSVLTVAQDTPCIDPAFPRKRPG